MMSRVNGPPASDDPRVVRTRATVLEAAAALLAERGFARFSIEALVERTGVSKTTIYRHWPSRSDLLAATVATLADRRGVPDTGSLRGDLIAFAETRASAAGNDRLARSLPGLIEAAERDPELLDLVAKLMTETQSRLLVVFDRAAARDELRPDLDRELASSLVLGLFFFRRLVAGEMATKNQIQAVVDMILAGIGSGDLATDAR